MFLDHRNNTSKNFKKIKLKFEIKTSCETNEKFMSTVFAICFRFLISYKKKFKKKKNVTIMEDIDSSNSSGGGAGLPAGRINNKKRNQKKPKKLAPIEGSFLSFLSLSLSLFLFLELKFNFSFFFLDGQLSSKPNQMISKVKSIHQKRDLIEAVRKVAPASVQLSPSLYHDIAANLKTVRNFLLFILTIP